MTLAIMCNASNHPVPPCRTAQFEPGIVAVADSRITYKDNRLPPEDDRVKAEFILNGSGIALYAGLRAAAVEAFPILDERLSKLPKNEITRDNVLSVSTDVLRAVHKSTTRTVPKPYGTFTALIGFRTTLGQFLSFELSNEADFSPKAFKGLRAVGTGGPEFTSVYQAVFDHGSSFPRDPFKGPTIQLWKDLANFLSEASYLYVEAEIEDELVTGEVSDVGGPIETLVVGNTETWRAQGYQQSNDGVSFDLRLLDHEKRRP